MIPLDRVREMLAAATPGPWGHYYDEDAGRPCVSCATPTGELCTYLVAVACSDMVEDAALIAAAPDLARDLLSLADALRAAEARAVAAEAERDEARVNLATALAPNAADAALDDIAHACGCAQWEYPAQVARDVLAVVAARDAAVTGHAALAAAVRAEREARRVARLAQSERDALEDDAWPDGDDDERAALAAAGERLDTAEADHDAKRDHLTALLAGAPCGYVEARVVRAYLAAREAVPEGFDADYAGADERARAYALWDAVEVARAALDAALAAAEGTR